MSSVTAPWRTVWWFGDIDAENLPAAGGKGGSLARMYQAGLPVPDGFVILPSGFGGDGLTEETWGQVRPQLDRLRAVQPDVAFAVRSSAASEDSAQASFAGEFETVLNVRGDEEVRSAIDRVYQSRRSERVAAYSQARGLYGKHEVAVVVQCLVPSECSGVLFTANPVTGRRGEAIISAAWGLGEAIVGGLVTPDTITVDKTSGALLTRDTADKQVMTVRAEGGTLERPVPEERRRAPVLSDAQASELVRLGAQIEALYGLPVDVEWALPPITEGGGQRDGEFAILQARPITALPEPEPDPPSEWDLPRGAYMAMRNNIVELMADPLSPLFRTLGLAAVNTSMHRLLAAFFGKKGFMPAEIIITVNGYAYYNGSLRPRQILWLSLHSIGIARRMFSGATARWVDEARPQYVASAERWRHVRWRELPAASLATTARELTEAAVDAYGALVGGVIPAAWISEGLFTLVYNRLVKRGADPEATTYLLGYDTTPIRAEKSLYDLAAWARGRPRLALYLERTPAARVAAALDSPAAPTEVPQDDWVAWRSGLQAHLGQYGHTIYNLDFANPVPADDPAPLLEACRMYVAGQGVDPRARQLAAADRRERATEVLEERGNGWRLRLCRRLLRAAQRYAPLREDGLADIGLAYPQLRGALLELGRRCSEAGMISRAEDVFWVEADELIETAHRLDRGKALDSLESAVARRKAARRAVRRITPPLAITRLRLLGLELGRTKKQGIQKRFGDTIRGVAASPGRVTAPASVVSGPEDFARMRTGDVLVAPLTTPAWTPLFARAAAIVTDVGGPLSHGSIVAREYGIPAVLGTGDATRRIRNGQVISVDGSAGVVQLSPR